MIGWHEGYNGYGKIQGTLRLKPKVSSTPSETHAALVLSDKSYKDFDFTTTLKTVKQYRTGSPPNPWEVGWLLWHYTDDRHFYSVNLKPNGWELGKEDPSYPGDQRYLITKATPKFPINTNYRVRVKMVGATITVWVNGTKLCSYTDTERPYASGMHGLYTEDAEVTFKI